MTTVDGTFYLVLSRKSRSWLGLSARITAKAPKCGVGEIPLELTVAVPRALFERPALRAEVRVPPEQKLTERITADVADNLGKTLTERLGMRVRVTAEPLQPENHWSAVLGVARDASTTEARAAYRDLHASLMADDTAEPEQITELNRAFDQCCREHEVQE